MRPSQVVSGGSQIIGSTALTEATLLDAAAQQELRWHQQAVEEQHQGSHDRSTLL
jgi:hypothetical protein